MIPRTIRFPEDLFQQVMSRSKINRRSFNAEVLHMVETTLSSSIRSDLKLVESMKTIRSDLSAD